MLPVFKEQQGGQGPGAECGRGRVGGDESREVTGDWMPQGPEGHSKHLRFCSARNGELLKDFKQKSMMVCLQVKRITQAPELRIDWARPLQIPAREDGSICMGRAGGDDWVSDT